MQLRLVSSLLCFAVYLLFAGTMSLNEALTGAGLATLCGAGTVPLTRVWVSTARFAFSARHAFVWGRALSGASALPPAPGWHSSA